MTRKARPDDGGIDNQENITIVYRLKHQKAKTRPAEDAFDDEGGTHQDADGDAAEGDYRIQGSGNNPAPD